MMQFSIWAGGGGGARSGGTPRVTCRKMLAVQFSMYTQDSFSRVTVTGSLRDLNHDGRWSTYDENVRKLSRVTVPPSHPNLNILQKGLK
jgi:hypothetical protein